MNFWYPAVLFGVNVRCNDTNEARDDKENTWTIWDTVFQVFYSELTRESKGVHDNE